MKKFTKIVLISILCLGLLGGILFGAGVAAGGSIDLVYEGNHLANTRLFRMIAHKLQKHEHRYEEWEDKWDEGLSDIDAVDDDSTPGNLEYSQTEVEGLLLEVDTGIAEIRTTTGNTIRILGVREDDTVSRSFDNKELYIEAEGDHDSEKTKLVIEVPENKTFKDLELVSDTAQIKTVGKLRTDKAYLETDTGSVQAEYLEFQTGEIECSTGNLQVKCAGKLNDYTVYAESDSGNLVLDGKEYVGYQEGVFGNADSQKTIDVSNDMGNMEIEFESK